MNKFRALAVVARSLVLMMVMTTGLAAAEAGGVTASGTNNAKLTVTISDSGSDFGSSMDPSGTDSDSTDTVLDYQCSAGNEGSYYVWSGTVEAAENSGTSTTRTIPSGAL
jgi:hypothetical protein